MTDEEKAALQYRFSGYELNLVELDESGKAYVVGTVHPYYINQPKEWEKPSYPGSLWEFDQPNPPNNRLFPILPGIGDIQPIM